MSNKKLIKSLDLNSRFEAEFLPVTPQAPTVDIFFTLRTFQDSVGIVLFKFLSVLVEPFLDFHVVFSNDFLSFHPEESDESINPSIQNVKEL